MVSHTSEALSRRRRETPVPAVEGGAPPLTPRDLVPHLRGLARVLRTGVSRAARDGGPPR